MDDTARLEVQWIRTGAAVGLWACLAYPAMVFLKLPLVVTATVAASVGRRSRSLAPAFGRCGAR